MSVRAQYDDLYNNYINGNLTDFVHQFHSINTKSNFIDYISIDLDQPGLAIEMMKTYFNYESK